MPRRRSATARRNRSSRATGPADPSSRGNWRTSGWPDAARSARASRALRPRRWVSPSAPAHPAAGPGTSVPSRFSSIHLPRTTGDVRFGNEVTDRMLPWPSSPRRFSSLLLDAAKMRAADVRDAVVPGEALVHKRVVARSAGRERFDSPGRCCRQTSPSRGGIPAAGLHRNRDPSGDRAAPPGGSAGTAIARRSCSPARRREGRRACAGHAARALPGSDSCPELAASSSASSGMLLHRKNDRRDASSRSLMR